MFVNKQDKQPARTTSDLEQRWKFGRTFAEFLGVAEKATADSREAADEAAEKVDSLDKKLTQTEVFLRLTNNGKAQGLFLGTDGELYINASYVSTGVLSSQDGTLKIDLENGSMKVGNQFEFNDHGLSGYGVDKNGELREMLIIIPGAPNNTQVSELLKKNAGSHIQSLDCDLHLIAEPLAYPRNYAVRVGYDDEAKVVIKDKVVKWVPNDDGTYWLLGETE